MQRHQHWLLAAATATLVILAGCSPQGGPGSISSRRAGTGVDKTALANAQAAISQPAWLRERLPEHTVAYLRIPSLWGNLAAPDGRPLDVALANAQHVRMIAALRKAAQTDPVLSRAGGGPLFNILLGDQAGPIEIALLDSSDGVSPVSRGLVTVPLSIPDIAAFNARVAALSTGRASPLQAPLDSHGDAALQQFGALHFDAASHRLFLSLGTTASAATLLQDMAPLNSTRPSPMQDAEREIDASGQGLFAWMTLKGMNIQLANALPALPPDGLLRDAIEHSQSIAFGWGTVDGHGRLQLQVRAPQARLLGYLAANAGEVPLKASGAPSWVATMALPGADNLRTIHASLDRDFGTGTRATYDRLAANLQTKANIDPIRFSDLFGHQLIAFADANGRFTAVKVRDRKALYATIDDLGKRFGWRHDVRKMTGGDIHHLHLALPDAMPKGAEQTQAYAFAKILTRIGSDFYWVEDGDYLVSAKVPQPLIDRLAAKPDTALGDWMRNKQGFDSTQTLIGATTTTHDMNREVYYSYLHLLDIAGNALGAPVDLSTLPTAKQLHLPTDGIASIALQANTQRLALQLDYEQVPLESLTAGRGDAMTTVAVVGILAAIAIPAYQDYVIRSQVAEGAALASGAKTAVAEAYLNRGRMPDDNAAAGVAAATSIHGAYVSSVRVDHGRIVVSYDQAETNSAIRDATLVFVPSPNNGMVEWSCDSAGGTTIPPKYLPSACR